MRQHGVTIIVPVLKGKLKGLRVLLNRIGTDIDGNGLIDFYSLSKVHFMRWAILPGQTVGDTTIPDQLVLSTNFDGNPRKHLWQFSKEAMQGIIEIYRHCEGFPAEPDQLSVVRYLKRHQVRNAAFYVGTTGRSLKQIHLENELRYFIQDYLQTSNPSQDWSDRTPEEIRDEIVGVVAGEPRFANLLKIQRYPFFYQYRGYFWGGVGLVSLALLVLGFLFLTTFMLVTMGVSLLLLAIWYLRLRRHEKRDLSEFEPTSQDADRLAELYERENFRIQNQITHLVEIKPGLLRPNTLRFVLSVINLLARTYFNRGNLGGIPSIHFARWAIIDRGKRLLFFSNFDGSWESYLGEFIDRASAGLTGVWCNTEGFPPTNRLIFQGSRNSSDFKAWVRSKQIETQVWFSAYKTLTVENINNNTEIRNGLTAQMSHSEIIAWLQRLK